MTVAFQGEIGAFSEQAARILFEELGDNLVLLPLPTFESVFVSVSTGDANFAVVPIENSLFGSVHANYDLLQEHDLQITAELKLRIVHNLMALPGAKISDISQVMSHPQALGQCKHYLQEYLPGARVVPSYDTAGSAKNVADGSVQNAAAIASKAAAMEYGLTVLAEGIESNHHNYTRFLVLAQPGGSQPPTAVGDKTSIVYAMRENVPGALFKSLAVFALRDIDLFKIESRPLVGSPFAYLFYLDFAGDAKKENVRRALDHLGEITAYLKILGSYPFGDTVAG